MLNNAILNTPLVTGAFGTRELPAGKPAKKTRINSMSRRRPVFRPVASMVKQHTVSIKWIHAKHYKETESL